jgi:hypothetical protein
MIPPPHPLAAARDLSEGEVLLTLSRGEGDPEAVG